MKKSLKVLCFVLLAIVALLIIAAIVISLFGDDDLKNNIESEGTKALNVGTWIFNKIVDFIIFCGRPVWNAYIKIFYKVGPMFVTGLWYEVVVKVAGVLGLLILVTGIFRFVVTQSRDDATGSTPSIVYLVGFIWLLFCAIVVALLVGAFVVFGGGTSGTPDPNLSDPNSATFKAIDKRTDGVASTVSMAVKAVNDAPRFTSTPVMTATVGALYTYDVDATDPYAEDTLDYSLTIKPTGMTKDTATGLIQWTPTSEQAGANDVVVKVADNRSVPASEIQSFTITASLPSTPVITAFIIADDSEQKVKKILLLADKSDVVQTSDDSRGEIDSGLYTSYDFSDVSIPAGSEIASVIVYVEHFEQEGFPDGKLQWNAGTGWPSKPMVWTSINAPVHEEELNEATDLWDVTSFVDTPEKVNSFQLQVKNNNDIAKRKTLVDYIYVVVEWY